MTLARDHVHGYAGDLVPLALLEAQVAAGERIVGSCGTIARLGQRALTRAGLTSRLVGSLTRDPYTGDDGHIMLEVWNATGWHVYDLDGNRQAVDAAGHGIPIVGLCAARPRHWRILADDPLYILDDPRWAEMTVAWAADIEGWYDHILGIPTIYDYRDWWFHDDADRPKAESLGFRYATAEEWHALLGAPS
jgi:hypothetical protein